MFFHHPLKTNRFSPRLVVCATTWSMIGWPKPEREWPLAKKIAAIKAAGFDGVCAYATPELKAAADRHELVLMSGFDCQDVAGALPRLRAQRDLGVHFINIQLLNHDTPPAQAARAA